MKNRLSKLVVSSTILLSVLNPSTGIAGNLIGLSPQGANDFHIILSGPIDPSDGKWGSSPFGKPTDNPNGPPSTTVDYSGPAVGAGKSFSLDRWKLGGTPELYPGSLKIVESWWSIDGTKIDPMTYTSSIWLEPVPEPASFILFLAGSIGIGVVAGRKKYR